MTWSFLTTEDCIQLHEAIIGETGGRQGIRDIGLLESAIFAPQNKLNYEGASIFYLGASYAFSISKNHGFVDGNKRTGLQMCMLFLELNSYAIWTEPRKIDANDRRGVYRNSKISPIKWDDLMVALVENIITEEQFADMLQDEYYRQDPPEIFSN